MSTLREAAQAVVDLWDSQQDWDTRHGEQLVERLRAALAQPETAEPPRDEWRPASEPPEDTRDVQAWIETDFSELDGVVVTTCEAQAYHEDGAWHVRGPDHDEWMQLCPGHMVQVVAWRDVQPPTEG